MARDGIGTATVEGIAREAGVARATVYRAFPGGRDELIAAAVTRAVADFFAGLQADIGDVPDVTALLERGLVAGRHRLDQEVGRFFHTIHADLLATRTLEEMLVVGLTATLRVAVDDEVLGSVIRHEPELVLPHFAFHQLDRVLALADALCRPHLSRFLPDDAVRPAAELLARVALTFAFRPAPWVDPHDPVSIRRLVGTYLLPALIPSTATTSQENP